MRRERCGNPSLETSAGAISGWVDRDPDRCEPHGPPSSARIPALSRLSFRHAFVALLLAVVATSVYQLGTDQREIVQESFDVGDTPVRVYRPAGTGSAPLVVVAHGFAGSRRLMEPLALALAGGGYVALTYDFIGHGSHPRPLTGDLMSQDGTPALLIDQTEEVVEAGLALPYVDGRVAVAGHSMATNILVRYAQQDDRVDATAGISMFAPTVDSTSPPNLLAVAGALEGRLAAEGRRVVAMVADVDSAGVEPFVTYRQGSEGTARRLVVAPRVEHIGVLYSATTLDETVAWIDRAFGRDEFDPATGRAHGRGLWILALMAGVFLLARPLAATLPPIAATPLGAAAGWRRVLVVSGVPAVLTPLILRPIPTSFLPVVVGDYLAVHFFLYGTLTALLIWWTGGRPRPSRIVESAEIGGRSGVLVLAGSAAMVAFFLLAIAWPLDLFFTSFMPVPERLPLLGAVLVGTIPYFLADEWLTRGADSRRGVYPLTKLFFLLSLGGAVALDFDGLFFLILIVPIVLAFFVVHGLFSRWVYRSTGSPLVAGLGNAVAFAWALAVTFPLYAGPTQ